MTPEELAQLRAMVAKKKAGGLDSADLAQLRALVAARQRGADGGVSGGVPEEAQAPASDALELSSPPPEAAPAPSGVVDGQLGVPGRALLGTNLGTLDARTAASFPPGARVLTAGVPGEGIPPGAIEAQTPQGPAYFTPDGQRLFSNAEMGRFEAGQGAAARQEDLEAKQSFASGAGLNLTIPMARAVGGEGAMRDVQRSIERAPQSNVAGGLASGLVGGGITGAARGVGGRLAALGYQGAVQGAASRPDNPLGGAAVGAGTSLAVGGALEGAGAGLRYLGRRASEAAPEMAMKAGTGSNPRLKKVLAEYGFDTPERITAGGRILLDEGYVRPFESTSVPTLQRLGRGTEAAGTALDPFDDALRTQAMRPGAAGAAFDPDAAYSQGLQRIRETSGMPAKGPLPSTAGKAQTLLEEVTEGARGRTGPRAPGLPKSDTWQAAKAGKTTFREARTPAMDAVGARRYINAAERGYLESLSTQGSDALDNYAASMGRAPMSEAWKDANRRYAQLVSLEDMFAEEANRSAARGPGLGNIIGGTAVGAMTGNPLAAAAGPSLLSQGVRMVAPNAATQAWAVDRFGKAVGGASRALSGGPGAALEGLAARRASVGAVGRDTSFAEYLKQREEEAAAEYSSQAGGQRR